MGNRLEELSVIRDEIISNPEAPGLIIWNAAKLALEDDYLYKIMLDWMKQSDAGVKSEILKEIIDYTEEILRKLNK